MMLRIFWAKWLALTVFENIAFAIRLAKIETRHINFNKKKNTIYLKKKF